MNEQLTIGEIIEFLRQRHIYVGIWVGEWDADGLAKPSDRCVANSIAWMPTNGIPEGMAKALAETGDERA